MLHMHTLHWPCFSLTFHCTFPWVDDRITALSGLFSHPIFFLVLYKFLQWIIHYGELVIECRREHEPVALIVMHPSA